MKPDPSKESFKHCTSGLANQLHNDFLQQRSTVLGPRVFLGSFLCVVHQAMSQPAANLLKHPSNRPINHFINGHWARKNNFTIHSRIQFRPINHLITTPSWFEQGYNNFTRTSHKWFCLREVWGNSPGNKGGSTGGSLEVSGASSFENAWESLGTIHFCFEIEPDPSGQVEETEPNHLV